MKNGFRGEFLRKLEKFSESDKVVFNRIYKVFKTSGRVVPPKEMTSWIESKFGSVEAVKKQDFIKIADMITYEGAIFNELRTTRPVVAGLKLSEVIEEIESTKDGQFSHPRTGTPADTFGRVTGKYCITASNVAKYDGLHGLIIYNKHSPLLFSRKRIRDYFDVAQKWFRKAYETNPVAVYPFYTWNCLWRAAASVIHGHSQLALTTGQAYSRIEHLRDVTHRYQERNRSNYFDDVYMIHKKMGLAMNRNNIRLIVRMTPIKEKEVMILSDTFDNALADIISDTLTTMKERLSVVSFNLSIVLKPLKKTSETWEHMPVIVRIVDRGDLSSKTADIGAMELYAQSVIGTNPYLVMRKLSESLK